MVFVCVCFFLKKSKVAPGVLCCNKSVKLGNNTLAVETAKCISKINQSNIRDMLLR